MPDFEKLYFRLFNRLSDILENIEEMNLGLAKQMIIELQQQTEDLYIDED